MSKITWTVAEPRHPMHITLPSLNDWPADQFTISKDLEDLLIKKGWTPPGQPAPVQELCNLKRLAAICQELNISNYTIVDVDDLNNWAVEVATAIDALAEQPARQEPWEHLKAYGYAPGGYMMTCRGCNSTVTGVDKRASRCMPCATKAAEQPAQQEPLGYLYELIVEVQVVNEKFTSVNWDTRYEPFGRNGVDHGGEVTKTPLYTSPPAQRTPLTEGEVWRSQQLMSVNADIGLLMGDLMRIIRATEAAHGIT